MASSSKTSGSQPNNIGVTAILDENVRSLSLSELVEKIIAKLPLKCLFQSLTLSREWSSKLGSTQFQREVLRFSSRWESYCPVVWNWDKQLVGYGTVSKSWHLLPTHPLPDRSESSNWELKCSCGSLLVWTSSDFKHGSAQKEHMIYVSNPLTRNGKKFSAPIGEVRFPFLVHAISEGSGSFKVIVIAGCDDQCVAYVQIFYSASKSWTESRHILSFFLFSGYNTSIYCGGIIDMIGEGSFLVSYNLEKNLWTHYEGSLRESLEYKETLKSSSLVLVNKSDVMLVSLHKECNSMEEDRSTYITVQKVDLESGLAVLVSKSSPQVSLTDWGYYIEQDPIGHGDCIYICSNTLCFRTVLYNVSTDKWSNLSSDREFHGLWTSAKYEPGLNPFLEV